jgi:hypothetical protein
VKLRAAAAEHFQAESERMVKEVRLELQRAIEESRREMGSDSSGNALL